MKVPSASRVWYFDCDGVLLDSNGVKTEAFRSVVAARYGREVAQNVVDHHRTYGGVSRFVKLRRLFTDVLTREPEAGEYEQLLEEFAGATISGLRDAQVEPDAIALLNLISVEGGRSYVVSGGEETELRSVLRHHGLLTAFDGVHGSPRTKDDILADLRGRRSPNSGGVFVGDSRLDMEVADRFQLERVFVTQWTEFAHWKQYMLENEDIVVVESLGDLAEVMDA